MLQSCVLLLGDSVAEAAAQSHRRSLLLRTADPCWAHLESSSALPCCFAPCSWPGGMRKGMLNLQAPSFPLRQPKSPSQWWWLRLSRFCRHAAGPGRNCNPSLWSLPNTFSTAGSCKGSQDRGRPPWEVGIPPLALRGTQEGAFGAWKCNPPRAHDETRTWKCTCRARPR